MFTQALAAADDDLASAEHQLHSIMEVRSPRRSEDANLAYSSAYTWTLAAEQQIGVSPPASATRRPPDAQQRGLEAHEAGVRVSSGTTPERRLSPPTTPTRRPSGESHGRYATARSRRRDLRGDLDDSLDGDLDGDLATRLAADGIFTVAANSQPPPPQKTLTPSKSKSHLARGVGSLLSAGTSSMGSLRSKMGATPEGKRGKEREVRPSLRARQSFSGAV